MDPTADRTPDRTATLSDGSAIGAAATVPRATAAGIAEKGISTKFSVEESPPF